MNRLLLVIVALGIFASCTKSGHKDCGYVENVSGSRISWKGKLPIRMRLHRSFPKEMIPALEAAMKVWNEQEGKELFAIDKEHPIDGENKMSKDGVNGIYFYSSWERDRSYEQARTSVYWKGDHIEEADIRVNAADFKFYDDSATIKNTRVANASSEIKGSELASTDPQYGQATEVSAVHMESLFVHELGHVLGMKHNDANPSVMATYLQNNSVRTALTADDRAALSCEY